MKVGLHSQEMTEKKIPIPQELYILFFSGAYDFLILNISQAEHRPQKALKMAATLFRNS